MRHMRTALAVQVCLALIQSFFLAPVQHVHETQEGDSAGGHEHSVLIHSHFSPHLAVPVPGSGPAITDNDGPEAWSLDTFTVVLPVGMHAIALSAAPDIVYAPQAIGGTAAEVDERAHDPPARGPSIPRAPPI